MKAKVVGNTFVLTSVVKVDDIKLLSKYNPEALIVRDENKKEIFRISYVEGKSSIAPFGVTFGTASLDGNGYAQVTKELVGANANNVKETVADIVAPAQAYLQALEQTIPEAVAKVRETRQNLMDTIDIA